MFLTLINEIFANSVLKIRNFNKVILSSYAFLAKVEVKCKTLIKIKVENDDLYYYENFTITFYKIKQDI